MKVRSIRRSIISIFLAIVLMSTCCLTAFAAIPLPIRAHTSSYDETNPDTMESTITYSSDEKLLSIQGDTWIIDDSLLSSLIDYSKIKQYPLLLTSFNERNIYYFFDSFRDHEPHIFACSDAILSGKITTIDYRYSDPKNSDENSENSNFEEIHFHVNNGKLVSYNIFTGDSDTVVNVEYKYDKNKIVQIKEQTGTNDPVYHYYTYDSDGRLVSGKYDWETWYYTFNVSYDKNGFVTQVKSKGPSDDAYLTTYKYKNGTLSRLTTTEIASSINAKDRSKRTDEFRIENGKLTYWDDGVDFSVSFQY